ncbi:RHS repeat protein [Aquimarina spongiae]|uniref:YD repeat-containing protein n=1 Tax=Aquimarina spongiae TaxID=570521 RepID=A0A1M6JUP7_9FLAO|nr:RHS repeat protein [Aquimarina spongiae]SHJ50379.1 hypothetical protein SAMN04488508_109255 [Aquimarina spongiae]
MKKHVVLLLMMASAVIWGQELPSVTPPSPTAFELGKYGEVPVGMFTGTANVSVPFYTYKTKNLSVPIALSYNSNGLRVDQMTSWVGLGWSLNAGGVITRTVKDEDDDGAGAGLLRNAPDQEIQEMVLAGGSMINPTVLDFYVNGAGQGVDTEYDIYNFNVMGASGRFILDRENRVHILSDNPLLKITTSGYQFNRIFTITTQDGIQYEFTAIESSDVLVPVTASFDPPRTVTSWYMTKIVHPLGDEITFTYTSNNYQFVQGEGESYSKLVAKEECPNMPCPQGGLSTSETKVSIYGLRLTGISSNRPAAGTVSFTASSKHQDIPIALLDQVQIKDKNDVLVENFDLQYTITGNTRAFLDRVIMKDTQQSYEFAYSDKDAFPSRLSKAQDYWGYYNGKTTNTHRVPRTDNPVFNNFGADRTPSPIHTQKGLLQRVTYPTKGYNEFVYEANVIRENQSAVSNTQLDVHTGSSFPNSITFTLPDNYFQNTVYPTRIIASMDLDGFACSSCTGTGSISIYDNTDNRMAYSGTISRDQSINDTAILMQNHNYTMSITTTGNLNFIANLNYATSDSQMTDVTKGGVRIKEVHTKDANGNETNSKYYHYERLDTPGVSSGIKGLPISFEGGYETRTACDPTEGSTAPAGGNTHCVYATLSSSTANTLFDQRGSAIYYPFVCVSTGDATGKYGMEEHEFIVNRSTTNQLIWGGGEFTPIQFNNADAVNNGFTKKVTMYTKKGNDFIKAQETINTYEKDLSYTNTVNSYIIRKDFNPVFAGQIDYVCDAQDVNRTYTYSYCDAVHTHQWQINNGHSCIAAGHNNITVQRQHPCYGLSVGAKVQHHVYYDFGEPTYLTVIRDQYNSERYYMDKVENKVYDSDGNNPLVTTTKYYYDNLFHRLPTRTEVTDSKGKQMITKTYYPDDVTSLSSLPGGDLSQAQYDGINSLKRVNQNRSATPVQVEQYEKENGTEVLLSTQRTLFKDWGSNTILPEEVLAAKGSQVLEPRVKYTEYDGFGNPTEVAKSDGTPMAYIWGYNHQYPVAKIENMTYSGVSAYVNTIQSKSDLDTDHKMGGQGTEGALRTELNKLRTELPTDAMVTTYTYDPMVGVTSMTDPRGYTVYYEYDEFNRLEYVRDADGNLISENKYHYKN